MFRSICFSIICLALYSRAFSGEIVLSNGDTLTGELFEINETSVVWSSTILGQVSIPKNNVKELYSSVPLKRMGVDGACYWIGQEYRDVVLQCGGEGRTKIALASLSDITLLDGYEVNGHRFKGKLVAVGTKSEGNRNRQDWLVDVDAELRHFDYRHTVGLKYDSEAIDDDPLREEYEAKYALDWFFSPQTFWFADSEVRKDETRDIQIRYSVGSGIGYQFWDTAKTALSIETGFEYVNEELDSPSPDDDSADDTPPSDDEYVSWRLASSYRYLFPRSIAFFVRSDYLQSLNSGDEWELKSESGFSLPIALGISAEVVYEYDFDNTPSEGLEKEDSMFRFGVGYEW